jgi:hypothetical protein
VKDSDSAGKPAETSFGNVLVSVMLVRMRGVPGGRNNLTILRRKHAIAGPERTVLPLRIAMRPQSLCGNVCDGEIFDWIGLD